MSSSSSLRLLPRLPFTSILPFIYPSLTCLAKQFQHQNWPIQLAFLLATVCKIFFSSLTLCIDQLKRDGTRWRMGGEVKGKMVNGLGTQYSSHYLGTWCIQHYYRWSAHLGCQHWYPWRFKWNRPFRRKTKSGFCACAITFQCSLTLLHFSHDLSNWSSPSISSTAFQNFQGIFDPLSQVSKYKRLTKLSSKSGILPISSSSWNVIFCYKEPSACWMLLSPWQSYT